ncbi:oxalurate catabolism protein HpxZ [Nocardia sp. alder85J]|uniref:oxalurate catabolism protein HpxZ n=1 Tax=Nocardia sp. alder85J TaxID=2862949 RepID=UPI001CD48D29|nr:oxalurate catabolism protein HpxZ [Nocardia sp. alder85J]MCX4093262.1 oxalurate catabolism protein HpxZ [Nocardia sp. alder85J]
MIVNDPAVVAEVRTAFERYEKALVGNDIPVLDELFWEADETVRFGAFEELFGRDEIRAFRQARPARGLDRTLRRTEIVTFDDTFAVVSTTFTREGVPGVGRQSQAWVRLPEGWRVVGAHVSQRKPVD